MRRRYNRELFAEKIGTIKSLLPDAFIGVDVIAGMRGETEIFFEDARNLFPNYPSLNFMYSLIQNVREPKARIFR